MKKKAFISWLRIEINQWVSEGIIKSQQKDAILKKYETSASVQKKHSLQIKLPMIIISLAALLLGTGIILFYASNWRKMPPSLKLVQVFLLIIVTYGAAYYLLAVKRSYEFIGRVILIIGMICYGAGIMLVAQIYHISSHPTNGVLAWALGVLAMSWVTQEKWGYYLAAFLFFVWQMWEYSVYSNPNYAFIAAPLVLGYLFYRARGTTGIILSLAGLIIWFYQIHTFWIDKALHNTEFIFISFFALAHIPLGSILIAAGLLGEKDKVLFIPSRIAIVAGWLGIAIGLVSLSWPHSLKTPYYIFRPDTIHQSIEFVILIALSTAALAFLWKKGYDILVPAGSTAYGLILFLLPIGNNPTLMVASHLGILAFLFIIVYHHYATETDQKIIKIVAFIIFISVIAVKGMGLGGMAIDSKEYYIAYCLGFVIFSTVCFLINLVIALLLEKKKIPYPVNVINSACAFAAFFILYELSFKVREQKSLFDADLVVIVLVVLFIIIGIILYLLLWIQSKQKLLLILSGIIFAISVLMIFITGPSISWIVYSIIFNLLLFILLATYIYYSTRINSKLLLNFAIAGFVMQVVTRYFDLFWDMLSGSILFIVTGIVGILGGWFLEWNRRRLLKKMSRSEGT